MLTSSFRPFCRLMARRLVSRSSVLCRGSLMNVKRETTAKSTNDLPTQSRLLIGGFLNLEVSRFHSSSVFRFSSQNENKNPEEAMPVSERIEKLVKHNKVVVFMKGIPEEPMCGFSNAVVQVLRMHGVEDYDAHNVLEDEELRQGIKDYSEWPTIPQVFLDGEFVGGCDILLQMHQSGDLVEELEKLGIKSALVK